MKRVLATLVLTAAVVPASAAADTIAFDHGAVKLGLSNSAITIVDPGDPLEINNVTFGPGDTFAASAAADFDFTPHAGVFAGTPFTIDLASDAPVTGTFDPATGEMATDPVPFTVTVVVGPPDNATCTYTGPLSFSTENKQVILGERFDPGAPPFLNGAISTTWQAVPGDPDPGCVHTNGHAEDQGGFWLSNGVAEPEVVPGPPVCPAAAGLTSTRPLCPGTFPPCAKGKVLKKGRCVKKKRKKGKKRRAKRRR